MSRRGFLLDLIYIDYMLNLTYYDFLFVFQNNHGMIHLLKVSATFCSTFIPRSNAKKLILKNRIFVGLVSFKQCLGSWAYFEG